MATSGRAIIVGASRGLGAGLARELGGRGWEVVATQRSESAELAAAAQADQGITIETVDIDDQAGVEALAGRLGDRQFDLVFINAGVMGPAHQSVGQVGGAELAALMMTNAIAPIRVAQALLPRVKDGGTVAFMTSILGSVGLRNHATYPLYSASKAALNSLSRGFAAQDVGTRDIAVINVHPGWVKTDMGGTGADIDVATSVTGIADMLAANRGKGHRYLDYKGATIPW